MKVPDATPNMPPPTWALQEFFFSADRIGQYEVTLRVWDDNGIPSCELARYSVTVVPEEPVRVELLWHTPNDPDETDRDRDESGPYLGTNVDLHFLHPDAGGQWFHPEYDCFAMNDRPKWNAPGLRDGPRYSVDDIDGGGPETVYYDSPEPGMVYRVGAHFRHDGGFGRAFATLRVYIFGELKEEWSGIELAEGDLWDGLTVEWPSQVVTRVLVDGQPSITHGVATTGAR